MKRILKYLFRKNIHETKTMVERYFDVDDDIIEYLESNYLIYISISQNAKIYTRYDIDTVRRFPNNISFEVLQDGRILFKNVDSYMITTIEELRFNKLQKFRKEMLENILK